MSSSSLLQSLAYGIPSTLPAVDPINETGVPIAPCKSIDFLSEKEKALSIRNALRYFPSEMHSTLAFEFAQELNTFGHVFMLRYIDLNKMQISSSFSLSLSITIFCFL